MEPGKNSLEGSWLSLLNPIEQTCSQLWSPYLFLRFSLDFPNEIQWDSKRNVRYNVTLSECEIQCVQCDSLWMWDTMCTMWLSLNVRYNVYNVTLSECEIQCVQCDSLWMWDTMCTMWLSLNVRYNVYNVTLSECEIQCDSLWMWDTMWLSLKVLDNETWKRDTKRLDMRVDPLLVIFTSQFWSKPG